MSNDHARYERFAVGHVVGGLDEVDAAAFRQHLLGCRECRLRVSELRGIASDLAAAEREERATATRVATEVERRQREAPDEQVDVGPWRAWPWATVIAAVVIAAVVGIFVWNLTLRSNQGALLGATQRLEAVLDVFADGTVLETTASTGTTGLVAVDGAGLAIDLAGLQAPAPDQRVVVWQLGPSGDVAQSTPIARATQLEDGRLALYVERAEGLSEVAITLEQFPVSVERPTGLRLLTAAVPPGS
jgi:hypothetical protein